MKSVLHIYHLLQVKVLWYMVMHLEFQTQLASHLLKCPINVLPMLVKLVLLYEANEEKLWKVTNEDKRSSLCRQFFFCSASTNLSGDSKTISVRVYPWNKKKGQVVLSHMDLSKVPKFEGVAFPSMFKMVE